MAERTLELFDEPVMDEQGTALQNAVERAERAEAELAKVKAGAKHAVSTHEAHTRAASTEEAPGQVSATDEAPAQASKTDETSAQAFETPEASATRPGRDRKPAADSSDVDAIAPRDTSSTAKADASGSHLVEPGSMDARKQPAAQSPEGHAVGEPEARGVDALRDDRMMAHLLDSLEAGKDIGHYGRLTFAMIARHFLTDDEVLAELTKDRDFSDEQARQMLMQVEGRDYSPPRRERILQWQAEQEFPIIPEPHDPDCGNTYKTLRYPKQTYDHIGHYQEEKVSQ